MITRLNLHLACSSLSIGQCGFNILRELYKRKVQCTLFPHGGIDLSPFKVDPQFGAWIERAINTRYTKLDRKVPTLSCWHIASSELKLSDRQYLLSFHETDSPTEHEIGILNAQDHTFFSSSWSVGNFQTYGAQNVSYVPLGFDEDFAPAGGRLVSNDIVHWILVGKHEDLRKMTSAKIAAWIKRYGNKSDHMLTICVDNPFYRRETVGFTTEDVLNRLFNSLGGKPANVNVLPHLKTNAEMNQLYNSADIDLSGFSRSEGWNVPSHTCAALGKWSIVSNCTAHKDWATAANSILVEPTGTVPMVDGIFFRKGEPFSQGNGFDFAPDAFDAALDKAEKLAKTPNPEGEKLRQQTWSKTVDQMLSVIQP